MAVVTITVDVTLGSSYQLLEALVELCEQQAMVDTCRLLRDDGRVSSRKEDSGTVLSSSSKKASRSGGL